MVHKDKVAAVSAWLDGNLPPHTQPSSSCLLITGMAAAVPELLYCLLTKGACNLNLACLRPTMNFSSAALCIAAHALHLVHSCAWETLASRSSLHACPGDFFSMRLSGQWPIKHTAINQHWKGTH